MTSQLKVEARISVRLQNGRSEEFWIDPFDPLFTFPQSLLELRDNCGKGSRNCQKPPPHKSGGVTGSPVIAPALSLGNEPPLSCESGGGLGGDAAGETKNTTATPATPQEEIAEVRKAISWVASKMAKVDSILAPGAAEERAVRNQIAATHERCGHVVFLDIGRKGIRAPMFRQLDQISRVWGPLKTKRAGMATHIRSLEKQIERLEKIIASENRKKHRKAKG